MLICFDPGHGGNDPGAVASDGTREATLALLLARRAKESVIRHEHTVLWTRTDNRFVEIEERPRVALRAKADAFISFHCNAAASPARGIEAWVVAGDTRSESAARKMLQMMALMIPGIRVRGVKPDTANRHGRLGVLRGCYKQMPAILIECGFLTTVADRELMQEVHFGLALGEAIHAGLRAL